MRESARECERDVLGLKTAAYACYLTGGKAVISLFNTEMRALVETFIGKTTGLWADSAPGLTLPGR